MIYEWLFWLCILVFQSQVSFLYYIVDAFANTWPEYRSSCTSHGFDDIGVSSPKLVWRNNYVLFWVSGHDIPFCGCSRAWLLLGIAWHLLAIFFQDVHCWIRQSSSSDLLHFLICYCYILQDSNNLSLRVRLWSIFFHFVLVSDRFACDNVSAAYIYFSGIWLTC